MVNNMNNLIIANEKKIINALEKITIQKIDGNYVIDSREVAEMIGVPHYQLMRSIRNYIEHFENAKLYSEKFFVPHTYVNERNKEFNCYLLTKLGCEFVSNKMTGEKGSVFTALYVDLFNEMENVIKQEQLALTNSKLLELESENYAIKQDVVKISETIKNILENERISTTQELELTELVNLVVTYELGGKDSIDYINNAKKTFPKVWKSVKRIAGVARKGDIPKNKYDDIIDFVNNWSLSSVPKNQMKLDI